MKLLDYLSMVLAIILSLIFTIQPIYAIVVSAKQIGFADWMIPMGCLPILSLFLAYSVCYEVLNKQNH